MIASWAILVAALSMPAPATPDSPERMRVNRQYYELKALVEDLRAATAELEGLAGRYTSLTDIQRLEPERSRLRRDVNRLRRRVSRNMEEFGRNLDMYEFGRAGQVLTELVKQERDEAPKEEIADLHRAWEGFRQAKRFRDAARGALDADQAEFEAAVAELSRPVRRWGPAAAAGGAVSALAAGLWLLLRRRRAPEIPEAASRRVVRTLPASGRARPPRA